MILKELNEETYTELVKHSALKALSLNDIIETAGTLDKFWAFDGIYYKTNKPQSHVIVINRKATSGGYNNNGLILAITDSKLTSNNAKFMNTVLEKISQKSQKFTNEDVSSR